MEKQKYINDVNDDDDLFDIDEPNEELRVKLKGLKIPEDNPFKNDGLDREKVAKTLTKFINCSKEGKVLALNGEWGTGKTTFIKMWMQSLKNANYPVIYYNAWEDDLSDEPLISMVRNLYSLSDNGANDLDKVVEVAGKVIVGALFGAVKSAAGIWGDIVAGTVKGGTEALQDDVKKAITNKDNSTTFLLREFRKELTNYVSFICGKKHEYNVPLVYFVDELDRCSPTFAVKVLERIKHLFEVPNVVFVLSVDKKQFAHSINGYFGSEQFDAIEYLRRFIDIEFCLPEPSPEKVFECLYIQLGNFTMEDAFIPYYSAAGIAISTIRTIARHKHCSIRQIERIYGLINSIVIQYKFDEEEKDEFIIDFRERMDLFFFTAYLKVCENKIYDRIRLQYYTLQGLCDVLENLIPEQIQLNPKKNLELKMARYMDGLSLLIYRLLEGYFLDLNHQVLIDTHMERLSLYNNEEFESSNRTLISEMASIRVSKIHFTRTVTLGLNTKSIRSIMEKMDFIGDAGIG